MVSVVTGSGLGLDQTSGYVLGSRGQLGSSVFRRFGESATVNAATGNLFVSRTDEILLGLGVDATVSRGYNSLGLSTDENGDNWQLGGQRRVAGLTGTVNTVGSTVTRYDWDGSSVVFTWDAAKSAYVSGKTGHQDDRLTFVSNVWTWVDSETRTSETYDHLNAGRLTAVKDADGNATSYSYTGVLLTRITTSGGEYTSLTWSGNNLTQLITTKSGGATLTRVRYTYDASNRLSTVLADLTPDDNTIADNAFVSTTYTYDGVSDRIASITQTGGAKLEFTYTQVGSDYRIATYKQTLANGVTSQVSLSYDTTSRVTTLTDQLGQVTKLTYDTSMRLTKIEQPPAQSGMTAQITTYTYDAAGNVLTAKDASNKTTTYQYDASGNLTLVRDAVGNTVTYTYGASNELLTETRYAVPDPDGAGVGLPSGSATTRYVYDAEYHLRYLISSDGRVTHHYYNWNGTLADTFTYTDRFYDLSSLTETQSPSETVMGDWVNAISDKARRFQVEYAYDFRGALTSVTTWPNSNAAGAGYGAATIVTYTYDQYGNLLTRQTGGVANTEVFTYDGLGRVTSSVDLNGATTSIAFTDSLNKQVVTLANGLVETSYYNFAGQLITNQTSASGLATANIYNRYDVLGRQRVATDALGNRSYMLYDALGRKVADIAADGAITEYAYDTSNRLSATISYATKITSWKLATLIDSNGNPVEMALSAVRPNSSADDVWEWRIYDNADRLAEVIDGGGGSTTFAYDGMSNLVKTTNYYNKLSAAQLALLKGKFSNRIYNASMDGSPGWETGYNPAAIVDAGSPYTGTYGTYSYVKSNFTATAAGQVASIATDASHWFTVAAGEQLTVQAGLEGIGNVQSLQLVVQWHDASGAALPMTSLGTLSGATGYNTRLSGTVTVPTGAVTGRLEVYMTSSASGTGSFSLIDPVVLPAVNGQAPLSVTTPSAYGAKDEVSRNFYDRDGNLVGALDGLGYLSQIIYDGAGRVVHTVAYANATSSTLRASGSFADLLASVGTSGSDIHTYKVYYNDGRLRYALDANLRPTEYVYDAAGNVLHTFDYGASIAAGSSYEATYVAGQISSLGLANNTATRKTWAVYDNAGRLAFAINAEGGVTGYSYNVQGQVAKTVQYATSRATTSDPTLTTMNSWSDTNTNANDRVIRSYYDKRGDLRYIVDAAGYVTRNAYDLNGHLLNTARYDAVYAASDTTTFEILEAATKGTYVGASYTYDALERLVTTTDALGVITRLAYDALDRVTDRTIAYGTGSATTTHYIYDAAGNVTDETASWGTADASTTHYTYDGFGNVLTRTSAYGASEASTMAFAYDQLGQLVTQVAANGTSVAATTSFAYDSFGNVIATTDSRGNVSYSTYDKLNRLIWKVDAERYVTQTTYTIGNEVASVTRYAARSTASGAGAVPTVVSTTGVDATTTFMRDKLGRVTRTTDAMGAYEEYTVDAFGNRQTVRNKLGGLTTNTFDKRGLLVSEAMLISPLDSNGNPIAGTGTLIENRFEYDSRGNRTKMIEAFGLPEARTTVYTYDKANRLTGKISGFVSTLNPDTMAISTGISVAEYYTYDVRGNLIQTKDPLGNRTLSYYDANDRKIAEIDPRGKLTRWTYDRDGNVKSIRVYGDLISVPANPGGAVPSSSNTNYREILYDYDRNGRLTKTTTGSVETFTFSSGSVIVAPIISSNAYDAAGNIVLQTDGRQNNIFNFYDKNGRKIGQVDAEKFVTSYTYDAEGNVLSETRFGTRLTLSVSSATNFSSVLAAQATSIDDRTTVFTYDRNGRRLTEKRLGVVAYSVNASGDLVSSADFSLISYTYNALGLVTSKKEAAESENQADGKTLYDYDSFGRQIKITGVKYKDFTGNDVRNVKTVSYDGLNNIIANVENGVRTTTYVYGPAGRLASVTDGANNTTKYFYDVLGRITATTYKLIRADSADQYVSQSLRYDAAGNQISQKTFSSADQAVWSQSGDMTDLFYNAYGEVVARGTNSNGDAGKAREFNEYDKAGRIWRTNFNDGVTKAYGYDANGNATLLMQSMGTTELKTIGSIGAMIADTGVSKTFSEYDARNQLTRTIQSSATNSGLSPIHAEKVSVDGSSTPINFQNTAVVDPWNRVNLDSSTSTINSTTSISSITTSGGAATIRFDNTPPDANVMKVFGRIQGSSGTFVLLGTATKTGTTSFSFSAPELSTQNMELRYFAFNAGGATVDARRVDYVRNAYGRIDPTTATSDPSNGFSYDAASKTMDIQFVGYQGITYGQLFIRPIGSSDFAYQKNLGVSGEWTGRVGGQVYRNYATVGIGDIDFKSPTYGTTSFEWQILYYTSSGSMVKTQTGLISGTPIGQASVNSSPLALNGGGQAMAISDGGAYKILFSGFPSNTANLRAYYRLAGSTNSFQEMAVSGGAYGQWFGSAPSDGQSYEFWVEPTTSGGGLAGGSRSYGTFVAGSGFAISLTKYQQVLAKIQFQAASGSPVTRQQVRYSTNGGSTWSAWNSTEGGGYKDLDLSAVASNFYSTTNILFEYETFNGSQLISHTSGNAAIGYDNQHVWNIQNSTIMLAKVAFNPLQSSGTQMKLYYRLHGTMGNFSTAVLNKQAGSNAYIWDVEGIRPISGQAQYDYYYDIYDNAGNLLPNLTYADHVSGEIILYHDQYINSNAYEIRWKVDVASASQFLIDRKQEHDAFGEISSETDGRGNKTLLSYNTMGKLVKKKSPQVSITGETGVDSVVNPTENYYYDLSGRQVGQSDANGNVTRQILLAGTGYGGSTAIVLEEYLPGASTTYGYDIFGDQRKVTQWINRSTNSGVVTTKSYDASHNLIQIDHPARAGGGNSPANTQLSDYYSYDAIGQRIKHWNSQLGENSSELTDHDVMGRITRTTTMSGQYVTYGYTYQLFGIATNGLGDFGGWVTYTWNSSQHQSFDFVDIFGRTSYKDGLHEGGDVNKVRTNFTYDKAGKLVLQTNTRGQNTSFTYYENGYVKSISDNSLNMLSTFEYDGDGNRTRETYSSGGSNSVYYQNAVISYDALNRVTRFLDPKADITYKYDAAGNRRNVRSRYHDGVGGDEQVQDLWYRYDGQNRFVLTMGSLSAVGQAITLGSRGVAIGYDALGNRISASYGSDGHLETYTYTADGYLENTKINGVLRSSRTNDKMGRVTNYKEFGANGVTVTLNRDSVFDNDSRVVSEVTTSSGSVNSTTFDYRKWNGSAYSGADQGVLIHTGSVEGGITVNTTFYYEWWDEAKQTTIRKNASDPSNPNTGAWQPGVSDLLYDVNGHIAQMVDHQASGGTKTVEFTNDAYGQVLTRETWQNGALGPRQLFYYFDGKRIGDVSNDGPSPNLVDYAQQLAARDNARSTGLYRYGKPIASADFDQSYQPINSAYPASAATAYTVRSGDTLRSIAQSVWGDADMWYLIAESNGLSASSQLVAGQLLTIPNKVANFHNNTGTFRVYDPGNAIGDTLPTLPNEPAPPPARSHGGCGGIGKILVAVVAIAVTAFVAPQLLPGLQAAFGATGGAIAAGAAAGAAGSIVSQGFGIATGIQQNFSFKGVALAAIAGGVGGGVGQVMPGNLGGSTVLAGLARGLTASVLTQGIGIATGLQSSFSWSAVAAAGVAGGVTTGIGGSDSWGRAAANFAGGLGGAAAASLVSGQDFGDTLMASLPSIIASTVGNLVAGAVSGGGGAYDRSRGYGRDEVIDVLGNGGMLDVSGLANNSLINVPTIAGIATSSAAGAVLASAPTVRQLGFSIPGGAPAETSIAGNGDIVITGQRPMRPSSDNGFYWSASTTGVWDDIQQAIGENRDAGLSQIGSGGLGYITGAMQYAFSPITGALEISHAYYSGRSWVAPVDREVTGYALLGAGSVQGMGAKLAQLGRSAEVVASVNNAAESVAPKTLEGGVAHEAERLAQLGIPKNNVVWRPGQADFDSAAFKVIVGEPKFTPGGLPKGTIFDGTLGGNMEIKGGSSILDSSYQLRLQTYRSLKTNAPLTIETTRPVNPTFQSWLDRWGVSVVAPK